MATNPDENQGKLAGVDYDCRLSLLEAVTQIDSKTAPQIGQNVRIVINGMVIDVGQKIKADTPHPYVKVNVDTMAVSPA